MRHDRVDTMRTNIRNSLSHSEMSEREIWWPGMVKNKIEPEPFLLPAPCSQLAFCLDNDVALGKHVCLLSP